MDRRVEGHVGPIIVDDVQLDLGGAWSVEKQLIVQPGGRVDPGRIARAGQVLELCAFQREKWAHAIAIAGTVAVFLGLARWTHVLHTMPLPAPLARLSRISYSVFLVHFPLCLLVNAAVTYFFPTNPVINAAGLLVAVAVSITGGSVFYRWVESYPFPTRMRLLFPAGVVASGWLTALAAANLTN